MGTGIKQVALAVLVSPPAYSWRYAGSGEEGMLTFDFYRRLAATAERGRFDVFFLADSYGIKDDKIGLAGLKGSSTAVDFEPSVLLATLVATTRHVGLVGTISTTYNEPLNVARRVASLDQLSGGRGGWNVVTSTFDSEAKNFNLREQLSNDERYSRANEFVDVVFDLWDTWEEGALLFDKPTQTFFDPERVHYLNHEGKHFRVRGPLNLPRSPQGRPVICQAGASEAGWNFAARTADVMYAKASCLEHGQEFYRGMKNRLRKYGRQPDDLKILPGLTAVVGRTRKEAEEKFHAVQSAMRLEEGLGFLRQFFKGIEFSGYPLDEPVPDEARINDTAAALRIGLERDGRRLTVHELMDFLTSGYGHLTLIGSGREVAQQLSRFVNEGGADGFNLMPQVLPGGLDDFVDLVVPELQEMGALRADYPPDATLRDLLGLPEPVNRFEAAREPARQVG